jgi:serine/threonine protein kinase
MTDPLVLAERYELLEVIGRGGMADVHRAYDRLLSRPVAVKMLRENADDETDRARFTSEARTLAGLSHSGLVMVLDAGILAERPYLVMELVEGRTLSQACAEGPLDLTLTGSVGVQVAEALRYAHHQGVVHRDVKPGNVLLGDNDRVKLADFGIARLIGDTVRHTRTGHAIGTAAYLSPEQVTGADVTPAADVYALGLVLLEALTGERAYPGAATEAALARLTRPPHVPTSLPDVWQSVLTAMTALEPERRPSADQVATKLRTLPTKPIPAATIVRPDGSVAPLEPGPTEPLGAPVARPSVADRVKGIEPHHRGVAGSLIALAALIIVVGLAAGSTGSAGPNLPDSTPAQLRQPLSELHTAVHGE